MKIRKKRLLLVAFGIALMPILKQPVALSATGEQERNDKISSTVSVIHRAEPELPSNILMPDSMRPILCKMLKRSQTFRNQCYEINQSRHLRIIIKLVAEIHGARCRALSTVRRYTDGQVVITTLIVAARNNYVELISHEFEHAIEQIEGLDLRTLASAERDRVYRTEDGIFETKRAIAAGIIVANEYNSYREQRDCAACEARSR